MFKKLMKTTVLLGMMGGLFLPAMSLSAAEATSTTTVTFEADTTPTLPVDPENPDNPGSGGGTGMTGPLSIDYVPDLAFGTHTITGQVEQYETENVKPFMQVTDKRGSGEGWTVTAALSEFTDVATSTKTLPGAKISFANPEVVTQTTNTSVKPATAAFELSAGSMAKTIETAGADEGMGTFVTRWFATDGGATTNDNVKLTVNTADAYATAYEGTLTWAIQTTP